MTAGRVRHDLLWAAIGGLLVAVLGSMAGSWAPGHETAAQDGSEVHVSVGGGEWQGEYDASGFPCLTGYGGPEQWSVNAAESPVFMLSLEMGGGSDMFYVILGDAAEYQLVSTELEIEVDDRGDSATLIVRSSATSPGETETVPVELSVECLIIDRSAEFPFTGETASSGPTPTEPARAIPSLTPVVLGSVPPGSITFRVELDSGPDAGVHEVWTVRDACRRIGDEGWGVDYADGATMPNSISILAMADGSSLVGTAMATFGAGAGSRTYTAMEPMVTIDDRGTTATLTIAGTAVISASAAASSAPVGEPSNVELALVVECGAIQ